MWVFILCLNLAGLVFVSCLCFALFAAGLYRSVGCGIWMLCFDFVVFIVASLPVVVWGFKRIWAVNSVVLFTFI